jgi:NAD+ diphosphatase
MQPPHPRHDDVVFAFAGDRLLVRPGAPGPVTLADLGGAGTSAGPLEVGTFQGRRCIAVRVTTVPDGVEALGLRQVLPVVEDEMTGLVSRASQLLEWYVAHAFCGRCGNPTELHDSELARRCTSCGALYFPRISPAVITLVHRDGEVLLARNRAQARAFYALIAGFVEVGETLEQAVRREIREEVGIEVGRIQYVSSQPWPFPSQLMVGFYAEYRSGKIVVQESELADARWFPLDALPPSRPGRYTIAGRLIDGFLAERGAGAGRG